MAQGSGGIRHKLSFSVHGIVMDRLGSRLGLRSWILSHLHCSPVSLRKATFPATRDLSPTKVIKICRTQDLRPNVMAFVYLAFGVILLSPATALLFIRGSERRCGR